MERIRVLVTEAERERISQLARAKAEHDRQLREACLRLSAHKAAAGRFKAHVLQALQEMGHEVKVCGHSLSHAVDVRRRPLHSSS